MTDRLRSSSRRSIVAIAAAVCVLASATVALGGSGWHNGTFEAGNLSEWSTWSAGAGSWFVLHSNVTPLSGSSWYGPAQGDFAAVTDQTDPGTNILYRPLKVSKKNTRLSFTIYYTNQAGVFCTPSTLDYTGSCNQQYRVDLLKKDAAIDSMDSADIVKSLWKTTTISPATLLPTQVTKRLSGLGKVILRVAEVDNQGLFQASIDNVRIDNG